MSTSRRSGDLFRHLLPADGGQDLNAPITAAELAPFRRMTDAEFHDYYRAEVGDSSPLDQALAEKLEELDSGAFMAAYKRVLAGEELEDLLS